jgi:hypothetical protein
LAFPEIEPWSAPVDPVTLLDELVVAIKRYVVISDEQAAAIALWVVHTHAFGAADTSPKLVAKSAAMRSGKSRLAEVLERLVARPFLVAGGIRSAALLRVIQLHAPSLLLDEMDTLMNGNRELREALRGIMNSGFSRRGARHVMNVPTPDGGWEPREFSTWAPQFLSGIGDLPGTIRDRSIEIRMQRKLPTEKVDRLRRNDGEDLQTLRRKCARWAQDNLEALGRARPEAPAALNDRAADAWEPLFAIADLVGERWSVRARHTSIILMRATEDDAQAIEVILLADLRELFVDTKVLFTEEILSALRSREDRPYAEFQRGQPITSNQLANLLKPYGIRTNKNVRRGTVTRKGFKAEEFADVFARYLPLL